MASASIEVSCSDVYSEHQHISVFAETTDGKVEVGKIKLYNNSEAYKFNARFVEVKFKGSIEQSIEGTDIKMKQNFNMNVATAGASNLKLTQNEKITDWKSYIENGEEKTKQKFIQANIEYSPRINRQNNIEYRDLTVNFRNFKIAEKPDIENGINRIKNSISSVNFLEINCDMLEFLKGMRELYEDEYGEESGVIFFIMPMTIKSPANREGTGEFDGFADDIFSEGKYILLARHHNLIRRNTITHEAAHTLGLFHSFQTNAVDHGRQVIPEHTFKYGTTENIMDYSVKTFSFWKYQWDKMRLDNHDLELIQK